MDKFPYLQVYSETHTALEYYRQFSWKDKTYKFTKYLKKVIMWNMHTSINKTNV